MSILKLPVTVGHSLGHCHMDGWLIPLFKDEVNEGRVLKTGMMITIETFMTVCSGEADLLNNDLGSEVARNDAYTCYWEHAVAVTEDGCERLDLRANEEPTWRNIF